jgi:predicted dienelactone hydrolase
MKLTLMRTGAGLGLAVAIGTGVRTTYAEPGRGVDLVLHDGPRNRDLPIKIYVTASSGVRPLIIFSPGFGGDRDGYEYLGHAWSAAGYHVIVLTHPGSDRQAVRLNGARLARDPGASYRLQVDRSADVAYVLNALDVIERETARDGTLIDRSRIGVSGHSMGAGTALLLAGARAAPPGGALRSFWDERVQAVVAMSPQGRGEEGLPMARGATSACRS